MTYAALIHILGGVLDWRNNTILRYKFCTFLYRSQSIYQSSNYCYSSILEAIAINFPLLFAILFKKDKGRVITIERAIEKKKPKTKMMKN